MRIFIQIVISFFLAWWPIVTLTSVMLFGGPGAVNDAKTLRLAILVIFYPVVIGVGLYLFKFSLWGIPPKWTLIATIVAPIVALLMLDYPRMLMNANAGIPNSGYFKNETQVYHSGTKIDADPKSFQVIEEKGDPNFRLSPVYGKDQTRVFLNGKPIDGADPTTFDILGSDWRYAKDARNIYFEGKPIVGVDLTKFAKVQPEVENDQSYTDGSSLIYWGRIVGKVDGETVRSIGPSYVKDRTQVFYLGKPIPGADPATFEIISDSYSRDKARVYFWTTEIPGARPETFQALDRSYAKDDQRVYHHKNIHQIDVVEGADAANFKVTMYDDKRGSEAFDGKNYFMDGKKLSPR
jgi:hypothetical protein